MSVIEASEEKGKGISLFWRKIRGKRRYRVGFWRKVLSVCEEQVPSFFPSETPDQWYFSRMMGWRGGGGGEF